MDVERTRNSSAINQHHQITNNMETDPTGRRASDIGAKLDAGKPRVGLMVAGFPDALAVISEVTTFGAGKYTDHGWRTVPNAVDRYTDAMYRHLLAHAGGEHDDSESGLPHMAHAAWNCLAVLQLYLNEPVKYDDRRTP